MEDVFATYNRAYRRKHKIMTKSPHTPIDLGIKQYKREHSNEPKRVLYFKQEMWNAFHELKGTHTHGE